jgi:hypothetical protein
MLARLKCKGSLHIRAVVIVLILSVLVSGCTTHRVSDYDLSSALNLDQETEFDVQHLVDQLVAVGWMRDNPERVLFPHYSTDKFVPVLNTWTELELDGNPPANYGEKLGAYIGYVGGIQGTSEAVPQSEVEYVWYSPDMTILESWFIFGIPFGGYMWPWSYSGNSGPCLDGFLYRAMIDEKMYIRAKVERPVLRNFLITRVEIVFPFGTNLEDYQIGRYMEAIPPFSHCDPIPIGGFGRLVSRRFRK